MSTKVDLFFWLTRHKRQINRQTFYLRHIMKIQDKMRRIHIDIKIKFKVKV